MKKTVLAALLCAAAIFSGPHAHAGEYVTYYDGETELEGYWETARCSMREHAPIVMIIHQWKGLSAYEKERAEELSQYCYHTFAIDMYGKGIRPQAREEAAAQAGKYKNDPDLARRRLKAALNFAHEKTNNAPLPVAAMGYCFGGTMALELARSGADVKAAISFHGGLSSKAPVNEPGIINASVQIHHGAADPHVPQEQVSAFMQEMDAAGVDWQLIQYANAVHAFTEKQAGDDPTTGVAYNEKADKRSWSATINFLEEILGQRIFDESAPANAGHNEDDEQTAD